MLETSEKALLNTRSGPNAGQVFKFQASVLGIKKSRRERMHAVDVYDFEMTERLFSNRFKLPVM